MYSIPAQRALSELKKRSKKLTAYDFSPSNIVHVATDEGSIFHVRSAFLDYWVDPESNDEWCFLFAEHHPAMLFHVDDLLMHGNLREEP